MREELLAWMGTYPAAPSWREGTLAGAPAASIVNKAVPDAIRATAMADDYVI
jgi:hypothetical protein